MIYSATVSQLINSIESHSFNHEIDSIGTRSINNSAHSSHSAASCKSISDPTVLVGKAVLDLKRAARESSSSNNFNNQEGLTEYWDTWNYWKKHPFVIGNDLLSGKLLLEHLLILTNLKNQSTIEIFNDLKDWLSKSSNQTDETDQNAQIVQLRDQLCAGFFLIYCTSYEIAQVHLNQIQNLLLPEYFEALNSELKQRRSEKEAKEAKRNVLQILTNFCLFLREFAMGILEKMKKQHKLLVEIIKSNSKNFLLFCKKLIQIIMKKLNLL